MINLDYPEKYVFSPLIKCQLFLTHITFRLIVDFVQILGSKHFLLRSLIRTKFIKPLSHNLHVLTLMGPITSAHESVKVYHLCLTQTYFREKIIHSQCVIRRNPGYIITYIIIRFIKR